MIQCSELMKGLLMPSRHQKTAQGSMRVASYVFKWLRRVYVGLTIAIGSYVLLVTMLVLWAMSQVDTGLSENSLQHEVIREAKNQSQDIVAVVHLDGPIVMDDSSQGWSVSSTSVSADTIKKTLAELEADDQVKAVVLMINSPGGSAVASDEIYHQVLKLKETKPVIAHFSQMAASGGYYIGAAASQIVAHPQSLTGSIGVIFNFYELSDLYQKLGVTANTIKSGEFKDVGSESRPLSDAEREQLQGLVDATYSEFVTAVARGRSMDESKVRELADGRLYTGRQALELGLVDQVGTSDRAIDVAIEVINAPDAAVYEYSDEGFWQSLFSAEAISLIPGVKNLLPRLSPASSQMGLMYMSVL